jgi:plasmid stabilization system protein ParE
MALEVFWSKRADKKFDKIIGYIEEEWGKHRDSLFVKKVYDFLDILAEFPEIGTIEKNELNIRGFVIVAQLTIFYQIREDKLIILNFYDNRQNPKQKRF